MRVSRNLWRIRGSEPRLLAVMRKPGSVLQPHLRRPPAFVGQRANNPCPPNLTTELSMGERGESEGERSNARIGDAKVGVAVGLVKLGRGMVDISLERATIDNRFRTLGRVGP